MKGRLTIVLSESHICDILSILTSLGNPRGKRSSSRTDSRSKHGGGVFDGVDALLRIIQPTNREEKQTDRRREKKGRGGEKAFSVRFLLDVNILLTQKWRKPQATVAGSRRNIQASKEAARTSHSTDILEYF